MESCSNSDKMLISNLYVFLLLRNHVVGWSQRWTKFCFFNFKLFWTWDLIFLLFMNFCISFWPAVFIKCQEVFRVSWIIRRGIVWSQDVKQETLKFRRPDLISSLEIHSINVDVLVFIRTGLIFRLFKKIFLRILLLYQRNAFV